MYNKIFLLKRNFLFLSLILLFSLSNCKNSTSSNKNLQSEDLEYTSNPLSSISPIDKNGYVNALIEIPSGTIEKWELDKSTGELKRDIENNKPRTVQYIGYPGNYGMIPQTLLSKENGGDGDPLDILVLGQPVKRGNIQKCTIIGVLHLLDRGEQDDKLIAVSNNSPFSEVNSITELNEKYQGISQIIETWFSNYKGPKMMQSLGFAGKEEAMNILELAIQQYHEEKNNN